LGDFLLERNQPLGSIKPFSTKFQLLCIANDPPRCGIYKAKLLVIKKLRSKIGVVHVNEKWYSRRFMFLRNFYFFLLLLPGSAIAADITWSNATTGQFTNDSRWLGDVAPGASDNALFTNRNATTISWNGNDATNANAFFNMPNITYTLAITNGNWWLTNSVIIGQTLGSTALVTIATGTLVVTNSTGTGTLTVGEQGKGTLTISGGTILADHLYVTNAASEPSSLLTFDSGTLKTFGDSVVTGATSITIGNTAATISEWDILGGTSTIASLRVGGTGTGMVTIAGGSTLVSNIVGILRVGAGSAAGNMLTISNGAQLFNANAASVLIGGSTGDTNTVLVSGSGSVWDNAGTLEVGGNSSGSMGNQLIVSNGGSVIIGGSVLIGRTGSTSNQVVVTGVGSVLTNTGNLRIGDEDSMNQLIISNGGVVASIGNIFVGDGDTSFSNFVLVTGAGSLLSGLGLDVGTNNSSHGSGHVLVTDNGTLQAEDLTTGFNGSGTISNRGGIFQFITASPTLDTNTVGAIVVTNGTISFLRTNAVNINYAELSRVTYQGNNTFQLNHSTGAFFSAYTFGTNNGANFQHFTMTHGATRWQATNTTLNTGGLMTFSNTTATIFGTMTNNAGTIRLSATNGNSTTVTFEKSLVVTGTGDGNGAIQNLRATNSLNAPMTLGGNTTISSASGKLTILGAITNGGNTLTVNGAGNVTLAAQISGTGGLAINGGGTVTISNSSANTFSGATTVTNSTVRLSKAGALGSTSGITLSASGTLLLDGGSIDRIGNAVGVTLDGGAITLNDLSETAGSLTLASNSTITFNFNASAGDLTFGSGSYTAGTLTINGWFQANEGGEDKLYFTNDPGSSFLNNITFTGYAAGARRLSTGEIIPSSVPEPGTAIGAIILVLLGVGRNMFRAKAKR
jgi:fibronectin-binding autotransporter adhesin